MSHRAIGSTSRSRPTPCQRKLIRQPNHSVSTVASGMTTSWPADMPPAAMPIATPRRASNQRAATVEPVVIARPPAPRAMRSPVVT